MKIYEGTLRMKKATKKMIVYGNDDLHAQYVPKTMFKHSGKDHPRELVFTIALPAAVAAKKPRDSAKNTAG